MAESEGFEPPDPFGSTVFKTAAFDRSASSPDICLCMTHNTPEALAYYKHLRPLVISKCREFRLEINRFSHI